MRRGAGLLWTSHGKYFDKYWRLYRRLCIWLGGTGCWIFGTGLTGVCRNLWRIRETIGTCGRFCRSFLLGKIGCRLVCQLDGIVHGWGLFGRRLLRSFSNGCLFIVRWCLWIQDCWEGYHCPGINYRLTRILSCISPIWCRIRSSRSFNNFWSFICYINISYLENQILSLFFQIYSLIFDNLNQQLFLQALFRDNEINNRDLINKTINFNADIWKEGRIVYFCGHIESEFAVEGEFYFRQFYVKLVALLVRAFQ